MASEALNWALSNGMTQAEFDKNIFNAVVDAQKSGTSNAMLRIEMDRLGITSEDVARATGVAAQGVQTQYTAAVPKTNAELVAAAAAANELAARTARDTTASKALIDARNLAATTAAANLAASTGTGTGTGTGTVTGTVTGGLTDAQKLAISTAEQALIRRQNEAALALQQRNAGTGTTTGTGLLGPTGATSVTGTTPFANATQGFAQNFRNYTSIPIGSQYNPNVVGGTGSPYSQIMAQMQPVGNPYAGVVAGQAMGGYNPALYDQIAAANLANTATTQEAARLAAATQLDSSSTGGMAKGGYVHGGLMFGANPPGPDDGAVNLDMGEYVIKKSSVDKYGRGLLDMINEGKVPAKKMKSLLG